MDDNPDRLGARDDEPEIGFDDKFEASSSHVIRLMHAHVSWAEAGVQLISRIVAGSPVVCFERGRWHDMRALRITRLDGTAADHQRGIARPEHGRHAVVKRDGKVAFIEKAAE